MITYSCWDYGPNYGSLWWQGRRVPLHVNYDTIYLIIFVYSQCKPHHDDVIKWKHFPRYWPFVRGIHRSPVNSPHKGQWRGALMFSLICDWINGWVNNSEAGDLRRHRAHYDVIVMCTISSMVLDETYAAYIVTSFLLSNVTHWGPDKIAAIFKCIFLNENVWILHTISLNCVPKVRINNIPALVQIMAWRRPDDSPISEPMMIRLLPRICVTQLQWVKSNPFQHALRNGFSIIIDSDFSQYPNVKIAFIKFVLPKIANGSISKFIFYIRKYNIDNIIEFCDSEDHGNVCISM